ncbi:MAG TPA: GNAT family N-acetyltransferase [Pseudomonas sp.]|uniref:GNAT family N-acetyltransferase n=1 Tax=Pseudomonas sp. TaxID=306 RepID=UPI002B46BEB2|nr:GNAT family N-acetyltransferase [Pseudomonas sp.]HKS11613.1 GNAT family N-acetyltransferase [Pseudomonas sp.]
MNSSAVRVVRADYNDPLHAQAIASLLDHYSRDAMGGGEPLPAAVLQSLASELAKRPHAFSVLAFDGDAPVGLVNCFEGFSTFVARPLVNVHDVVVLDSHRGLGISQRMLAEVESIARERGCCKLTLEVLEGNVSAQKAYRKLGYGSYALDPEMGKAMFWQKVL